MAIPYKVQPKKNPTTKEVKYYAQKAPSAAQVRELDDIAELIEVQSAVSRADVKSVLDSVERNVIASLRDGYSVRFGDLGAFHLTLCSTGEEKAEAVTAANIKRISVRYTPSPRIYRELSVRGGGVSFYRVSDKKQPSAGE